VIPSRSCSFSFPRERFRDPEKVAGNPLAPVADVDGQSKEFQCGGGGGGGCADDSFLGLSFVIVNVVLPCTVAGSDPDAAHHLPAAIAIAIAIAIASMQYVDQIRCPPLRHQSIASIIEQEHSSLVYPGYISFPGIGHVREARVRDGGWHAPA